MREPKQLRALGTSQASRPGLLAPELNSRLCVKNSLPGPGHCGTMVFVNPNLKWMITSFMESPI